LENKAGFGADWDEDEDGAGDGAGDDLEFGFYRGGAEEYDSDADEDDEEDEGDGIAGILKNPSALTDSRYTADFEQLERLGQGGFGTVYANASHLHSIFVTLHQVQSAQQAGWSHLRCQTRFVVVEGQCVERTGAERGAV
jgi:hypothetical protein